MYHLALISGILCPIAAFLNIQAFFVPGWIAKFPHDDNDDLKDDDLPTLVILLSILSIFLGIVSVICLWLRMLEKKIKWTSRLVIYSSCCQGLCNIVVIFTLLDHLETSWNHNHQRRYMEGFSFSLFGSILSFTVAGVAQYKQYLNRSQPYVYTDYDLSPNQRQLVILEIATLAYLVLASAIYAQIENWSFNDALYFCITTYATIGLGDLYPRSTLAKALLPIFATAGIVLVGSLVYAIRNVILELITLHLQSSIEKSLKKSNLLISSSPSSFSELHNYEDQFDLKSATRSSYPLAEALAKRRESDLLLPAQLKGKSPMLVPTKSDFQHHHHSAFEALDLAHTPGEETTTGEVFLHTPSSTRRSQPTQTHKEVSISRSDMLPQLSVLIHDASDHWQIIEVTKKVFFKQIMYACFGVVLNLLLFALVVSTLEKWSLWEGLYFSYCALTTIGFGDYNLKNSLSRALFIWHVIIGIGSITYFSSMVAERALDQWTIQINKIEQRVGRYEKKAQLKKMYGKNHHNFSGVLSPKQAFKNYKITTSGDILTTHHNLKASRSATASSSKSKIDAQNDKSSVVVNASNHHHISRTKTPSIPLERKPQAAHTTLSITTSASDTSESILPLSSQDIDIESDVGSSSMNAVHVKRRHSQPVKGIKVFSATSPFDKKNHPIVSPNFIKRLFPRGYKRRQTRLNTADESNEDREHLLFRPDNYHGSDTSDEEEVD